MAAEVGMGTPPIITDMKIITITMATTTITTEVAMKTLTTATKISRSALEEGVVEQRGGLLRPEPAGLLLPAAEPLTLREEAPDQQEARVVREEVPSNKEAAGYVVRGVAAVEM